jgi:hypothetical protein
MITHEPEIMWKLIKLKLLDDKIYIWKEIKNQIYDWVRKGCYEWFIHNNKMRVIWEWKTSYNLIN